MTTLGLWSTSVNISNLGENYLKSLIYSTLFLQENLVQDWAFSLASWECDANSLARDGYEVVAKHTHCSPIEKVWSQLSILVIIGGISSGYPTDHKCICLGIGNNCSLWEYPFKGRFTEQIFLLEKYNTESAAEIQGIH